ncbi:DUF547 domain-containing protein [Tamlana crocina]|uniref:DUF547 domain-containing protein n=1 Tax=Tamlana crocina TaxID=393006 RepID=A0ABX1DC37_9FLAO|nr:DUF547 domain-containing protein [Tamlana crocina]NJX14857.1 DUF547 domain-containing protein [Tamlana crocina]
MIKRLLIGFAISFGLFAQAQHFDHSKFSELLQAHVSEGGNVNYSTIKANPNVLNQYLAEFSKAHPTESWPKNETLAYWINAYNAFTIKLIIDNYPIKSIKDLKHPWDQKFIPINGKLLSLNHIEHDILRKMGEPRIHFAIVCASHSCPKLQNEAFVPSRLDEQFTHATKTFLNDPEKNVISKEHLELSKIFKWFKKDFEENGSLIEFISPYTETTISKAAKIKYKDYNWTLNE